MAKTILISIILFIVLLFTVNESSIYKFGRISYGNSNYNHPEHLYKYAWILKNEGKYEKAKTYLDQAISEVNNPDNFHINKLPESKEKTLIRFKKAKVLLESKKWDEFEEVSRKDQIQH